jgi:hypothetical protein
MSGNGFILVLSLMVQFHLSARDHIVVEHPETPKSEKEALLILVGFGSKTHNVKHIARYFSNKGYDLYQPDYISRKSIAKGVDNVDRFVAKHDLRSYKKVHVFCYIIGGWTFNTWYAKKPLPNIASVIYDRSPLQERAPYALMKDIPVLIRLLAGNVMKEFSETPYPQVVNPPFKTGILIETIPTKLISKHRKTAAQLGPVNWTVESLKQSCTDYCYVPLNHDDFYTTFELTGTRIFEFIREGKFAADADRNQPVNDPLQP